jgi:NAD(P)-dependent dehydrogenase (short-subunit alcohol dehydrogenase family)
MSNRLIDQRVLVIGGSSGIGEATALQAAHDGARVTIASRSPDRLTSALARLPRGVTSATIDASDADGVAAFFRADAAWDHVVVTASATRTGPARDLPMSDAHADMQSKFWSAYHVGRSARIAAGGSLTFVSGVYSVRPSATAVLQGAINAALEALARGLALELAPAVRVNAVSPSTTETPLWDRLGAGKAGKFAGMTARLPVRRIAQPGDIAAAILFLAANPFTTGSTLLVDGGDALV